MSVGRLDDMAGTASLLENLLLPVVATGDDMLTQGIPGRRFPFREELRPFANRKICSIGSDMMQISE